MLKIQLLFIFQPQFFIQQFKGTMSVLLFFGDWMRFYIFFFSQSNRRQMAFVYRSPRNLEPPSQQQQNTINDMQSQIQEDESKPLRISQNSSIMKGPAFQYHPQSEKETEYENLNILGSDSPRIHDKPKIRKPVKHCEQFFFRSKHSKENISSMEKDSKQCPSRYSKESIDQLCSIWQKQKEQKTMNLLEARKKLKLIQKTPSIPGKMEKFGYVTKETQSGFKYPVRVSRPRFAGDNEDSPGPGEYDYDIKPRVKGVFAYISPEKQSSKPASYPNNFFALVSDEESVSLQNKKLRDQIKKEDQKREKIVKKRKQLQTREESDGSESGVTVYDDDETPGPGYYPISSKMKKSFRSQNEKFQKIFINKSSRLGIKKQQESSLLDFYQPCSFGGDKNHFYISKLKRNLIFDQNGKEQSPDYYDTRKTIENDIISKMLKNSPNLYNNKIPRIGRMVNSETPGPGYYDPKIPDFKVETLPSEFISNVKPIQSSASPQKTFDLSQKQLMKSNSIITSRIHEKKDEIVQKENYAPFGSTSLKSQISIPDPIPHSYLGVEKVEKKQSPTPFNSSAQKFQDRSEEYEAGVGLYDLSNPHWAGRSYNVLFN